jgi:hypothetical protein
MTVENTGEKLVAESVNNQVEGIAPVADIEYARAAYKGKVLWLKEKTLRRYVSDFGDSGYVGMESSPTKVDVVDVVPGENEESPVRFVLKTPAGEVGFIDVSLSGTNASDKLRAFHLFGNIFFVEQPVVSDPLPEGLHRISTEYDRFSDTTTAVLQDSLSRPESDLEGLWVTAVAKYKGTKSDGNVQFAILLSSTDKGSVSSPLQYSKADTLYLLTDAERLSLPIKDYTFNRSELMQWVQERATVSLTASDVESLLKAKSIEGKWGTTEFRVAREAVEGFKEFATRLQYKSLSKSDSPSSSYTPAPADGTVNVKGYYRKDGTYVHPHTRSAPSRKH